MYPQVTRASSVASGSTAHPQERPFVPQGGPEHPYGLYQNAVPEEEDDDGSSPHIPLGFGSGSSRQNGSTSSGNDTGDIVSADNFTEQLPPYSRYADNVIAKGDMAAINQPTATPISPETTSSQSQPVASDSDVELNPAQPEQMEEERDIARKEGWVAKSKRRKCCGMPLWAVILACIVVILAAAIGGIIGGIIGNDKGTDRALR
jgi:hypothetical protein